MTQSSLGHLLVCTEFLGLAEAQKKALAEGRAEEAERIMSDREGLILKIKELDGIPPVDSEREAVKEVLSKISAVDEEIKTILAVQMSSVKAGLETVAKTREFIASSVDAPAPKKGSININV